MKSPSSSELQKSTAPTSSEINALKKRWKKIVNIHWDENPVLLGPDKIRYYRLTTMDCELRFRVFHVSRWNLFFLLAWDKDPAARPPQYKSTFQPWFSFSTCEFHPDNNGAITYSILLISVWFLSC